MKTQESKPRAECAVHSSPDSNLELFRLAIDQGPDAVILADLQGKIQIWNHAAADLFGFLWNEAIGQSLDIIIPEHLRQAHWKGYCAAIVSGHSKYGNRVLRTRAIHKTGRKLYVNLAFSIVKDREGSVIGAMATARASKEKPDPKGPLFRSMKRSRAIVDDTSTPNAVAGPTGLDANQKDAGLCAAER